MKKITSFLLVFVMLTTLWGVGEFLRPETRTADASLQDDIRENERKIEELERQRREHARNIEESREKARDAETLVRQFNEDISHLENQLALQEARIEETQLNIREVEDKIQKKQERIESNKEQLASLIREIDKNDDESLVELAFRYENFSEFYNQVAARETINEGIAGSLSSIQEAQKSLEENRAQLEEKNEELEARRGELAVQRSSLNSQRANQQALLNRLEQSEQNSERALAEIERQSQEIRREIEKLEERLRQQHGHNVPAGQMLWPLNMAPGNVCVTQGYGNTGFTGGGYTFHNGIDIGAPIGTPIRAAESGTVQHVQNNHPFDYGLWVTVRHSNGLVTLYAHLSGVSVSPGQHVNMGDVVGGVGSTGNSTGPHLHFTVFAPNSYSTTGGPGGPVPIGASINPGNYLDGVNSNRCW